VARASYNAGVALSGVRDVARGGGNSRIASTAGGERGLGALSRGRRLDGRVRGQGFIGRRRVRGQGLIGRRRLRGHDSRVTSRGQGHGDGICSSGLGHSVGLSDV
jgi:hypothetical protein